jgi:hypothetical protein
MLTASWIVEHSSYHLGVVASRFIPSILVSFSIGARQALQAFGDPVATGRP